MTDKKEKGISLRSIHIWLVVIMVLMAGVVAYSTSRLISTFNSLTDASDEHLELEKAAHELMDASDYLTENVQRFTIDGDMVFLEQYFEEALETNRREEALKKMDVGEKTSEAHTRLKEAVDNSIKLMDREYYAMKLVIEAKGYTEYPDVLKSVKLSDEDKALSSDDKMRRATEFVLDSEYYEQKNKIRTNMQESLEEVDKLMFTAEGSEFSALKLEIIIVRIVIVIQTLIIIFIVWLTARLGINPVLKAVDKIKEDCPIPETGANEFRYLAKAYNKMYARYRTSLEQLEFKASHDELTGAYNRAGYELLMSGIDLDRTCMMLLDVDNFKNINDTNGHETGDKVLIKLVQILKKIFRDGDHVCRIGGDEFVVLMEHSTGMDREMLEAKMDQINKELENTDDGLPPISISVGVVHGKEATDVNNLFEKTDAAMYESKKKGKHTYTFYSK